MNREKFACPKCGEMVPKAKSVFMSNLTKIRCKGCGAKIRPDRISMTIIGVLGGGIGGTIGALIAIYALANGNWFLGALCFVLFLAALLAICSYCTIKFTSFVEVREKNA